MLYPKLLTSQNCSVVIAFGLVGGRIEIKCYWRKEKKRKKYTEETQEIFKTSGEERTRKKF